MDYIRMSEERKESFLEESYGSESQVRFAVDTLLRMIRDRSDAFCTVYARDRGEAK